MALARRRHRSGTGPPRSSGRLGFVAAGALVAVGYMDPGNCATVLADGASYGYTLLGVVLMANLMAMLRPVRACACAL